MNGKIFLIAMMVLSGAIMVVGAFAVGKTGNVAKVDVATKAKAEITEANFDWGTITLNGGLAEKIFRIRNAGEETLKLYNVLSSCACTTAQLFSGGVASPIFRMHAKSDFVTEVSPGGTAELKVVFDPAFHGPNGVGAIERVIKVSTNDPQSQTLEFNLTANVVK